MDQIMTKRESDLLFLQGLIPKNENLFLWCYTPEGKLLATSCPENLSFLLDLSFEILGAKPKAFDYLTSQNNDRPLLLGSSIGLQWAASLEKERHRTLLFIMGPVLYNPISEESLRVALRPYTDTRERGEWAAALRRSLPELPLMSYAVFTRYVVMIHNTLTGDQIGLDALSYGAASPSQSASPPPVTRDRGQVYQAEKALLQMVRKGDINYYAAFQNSSSLSSGVPVKGKDPLQPMRLSLIVFTTLVSRAAMEGGLNPEIAYALGDSYIQAAQDCRDSGELSSLTQAMYHDFIYRVHHLRVNPDYSPAIQKCCDYIELSVDRKIRTRDLASLVGYTEYYLTEKFKKETGMPLTSYIRAIKLERAKVLLETTALSVQQIAEQLAFNTVNYFIQCFREATGLTPAKYRSRQSGKAASPPLA